MSTIVESVTDHKKEEAAFLELRARTFQRETRLAFPQLVAVSFDDFLLVALRRWSLLALRLGLGLVFLWFGLLKVFGISPVAALVRQTYPFLPFQPFLLLLGLGEIAIGSGLILKWPLRLTLVVLWAHMLGTFVAVWQSPGLFFLHHNPLWLTMEGEFVVKNLVLLTASLVIGGYAVNPGGQHKELFENH